MHDDEHHTRQRSLSVGTAGDDDIDLDELEHDVLLAPSDVRFGSTQHTRQREHSRFVLRAACGAVLFAALCGWVYAAYHVCSGCNRLGNFLDYWYQHEVIRALDVVCPHATERTELAGIARGVGLRRLLRFEFLSVYGSLAQTAMVTRAVAVPRAADAAELGLNRTDECAALYKRAAFRFATSYPALRAAASPLSASLNALLDATRGLRGLRPSTARTCVVHVRAGDFLGMLHGYSSVSHAAVAESVVEAAHSFEPRPDRFELLDSGVSNHCGLVGANASRALCGGALLDQIAAALRAAFASAPVVMVGARSPDVDFAAAAQAPMLVVGSGGTFAYMAAVANRGQVRTPACMLAVAANAKRNDWKQCQRTDATPLRTCDGDGKCHWLADGGQAPARGATWQTYAHPMCHQRCHR
jgi:hypothetical protein